MSRQVIDTVGGLMRGGASFDAATKDLSAIRTAIGERALGREHDGPYAVDTIPANTSTTEVIGAPGSITSMIDTIGDQDWFRVTLTAGTTYSFALTGSGVGALSNPYLALYNSSGTLITVDDDSGPGANAFIASFTPSTSGSYYLGASGLPGTGTYVLDVLVPSVDTIAATIFTANTLTVNGAVASSAIDSAGDQDWFRITLTAGESYAFSLTSSGGTPLSDPYLVLRDAAGNIVSLDDDGGAGLNALMQFTATSSGTFFLSAQGYSTATGGYTISAVTGPPQDPLDTLDLGFTFATSNIAVYFAGTGEDIGPLDLATRSFTAGEQAAVMLALGEISNVINVAFTVAISAAAADFTLALNELGQGVLAQTFPGLSDAYLAFDPTAPGWDAAGLLPGGLGYSTIIHEVGHALGLDHPHYDGGDTQVMQGVTDIFDDYGTFLLNQQVFTIMSYNDGWPAGPRGAPNTYWTGQASTPMALDIAALQDRYGANNSFNASSDNYALSLSNSGYRAIWDTGGVDTISYSGSGNATIDLNAATLLSQIGGGGFVSYVSGLYGGFTIANGVVIENASGGSGADTLIGNSAANMLLGGAGADMLTGGDGNDTLLGGAGNDTIQGGDGSDSIDGGADDDTLVAGNGAQIWSVGDVVDGGDGIDQAGIDLAAASASIAFDAAAAASNAGFSIGGATFRNMERITLTTGSGDDTYFITSVTGASSWAAGAGNDVLTVDFSASPTRLSMAGGALSSGSPPYFTISGVEIFNITGSALADYVNASGSTAAVLHGRDGADLLIGGAGNDMLVGDEDDDTLLGGAGNDTLQGGDGSDNMEGNAGADTLDGGAGVNTLSYTSSPGAVLVNLGNGQVLGGDAQGDVISNFQNVIGSSFGDALFGSGLMCNLSGWQGVDFIAGGSNNDTIEGGAGGDVMNGNAGVNTLSYANSWLGVTVNLGNNTSSGGDAQGDVFLNFQNIYGSAQADTLIGDARANEIFGFHHHDTIEGGLGADILDGGSGTDTLSYASSSGAVLINLGNGQALGGDAQGDIISNFEIVIGSAFGDALFASGLICSLFGRDGVDFLAGGSNEDTIEGGAGGDVMNGNAGINTLSYASSAAAVTVNLSNNTSSGGDAQGDIFLNFQNVQGSIGDDVLIGDAGANSLIGGGGNDTIEGGFGADWLFGGAGSNTLSYASSAGAVLINLGNDQALGGDAQGDFYSEFQNVIGSANGDALFGGGFVCSLFGGGGVDFLAGGSNNDTIEGGVGGDVMNGNAGVNTLSYASSAAAVTVNLSNNTSSGGDAQGDTFSNFQNLIGSANGDTLTGDAGANVLNGGAGADALTGGAGDDTFVFQAGAAAGDTIADFNGNAAALGDSFQFHGFGTAAQGATFTQISATDWQIHSGLDGHDEIITLLNSASVHVSDYLFAA